MKVCCNQQMNKYTYIWNMCLQDGENTSEEDVKKMYLDMALNVFGKDVGWVSFQGLESEVTYEHIIDAMLNNFDNSIPDKNNLEVNNYFHY